ncbi:MAG: hypothetical protein H7Y14_08670 [Burkholderiales bacterium]|nr:hypothetical protein [Burkholderiales bacterium]
MQSHTSRVFTHVVAFALNAFAACAGAAGIEVNPAFPAYGQDISVQFADTGPAPYIPATRYHRNGGTITLELERIAGGYFGWRSDMAYLPVALGELAPGRYTVQAKLFDISNPDAPPYLFTHGIDVAAPDAPGVYAVPRTPGAYEGFQLVVRADGPIDASSLRATIAGSSIRVDFEISSDPAAPSFATVSVAGVMPGGYRAEAFGRVPGVMVPARRFAGDFRVDSTTTVVEYYSPKLDHYLISAWPDEIAALDADPRAAFQRTGERFKAWLRAADAPASAAPVCRFYASGPNSHFYTADAGECQYLKSLEAKQRADATSKGQSFRGWQFEAIAFYAAALQGGSCPAGTRAVYRAYNNRAAQEDANHRFTASGTMRAAMRMDWADEGVAFCSPL